ncbi:hypothetical protein [Actinomadura sp. 9N407]|uniref:hypothetical protein n=1 Tax=Actinomadura sp. 9N407 TaxID=3375154 RepID=UPI0037B579B5
MDDGLALSHDDLALSDDDLGLENAPRSDEVQLLRPNKILPIARNTVPGLLQSEDYARTTIQSSTSAFKQLSPLEMLYERMSRSLTSTTWHA